MKQIDKEVLLLGILASLYRETGVMIEDIIPNFNSGQFQKLYEPLTQEKDATEDALKYLANDIYKRIAKKFAKG
jgi:hypothetical protein